MNSMTRRMGWRVSVAALAVAGLAFAQNQGQNAPGQQSAQHQATDRGGADVQVDLRTQQGARAGEMNKPVIVRKLGNFAPADVKNEKGEDLGKIEDVIVDTGQGRVVYAILSSGGLLGIGDKNFAIPFTAFNASVNPNDFDEIKFVLKADKNKFQNAKGFDKDNLPDLADMNWARETHQYWGVDPYWEDRAGIAVRTSERGVDVDVRSEERPALRGEPISPQGQRAGQAAGRMGRIGLLVKGEDMVGHNVLAQDGKEFAELEAVMTDVHSGRLVYGIVQIDDAPDFSKDFMHPVPWQMINVQPTQEARTDTDETARVRGGTLIKDANAFKVVLNVSRDKLQSGPKFGEREWPNMTQNWGEQVYNHYGVKPFWKEGRSGQQGQHGQSGATGGHSGHSGQEHSTQGQNR